MSDGSKVATGASSSSLVLRAQNNDGAAWQRLARIYVPVVYSWARQAGLQPTDAADLGQEVFQAVASKIGDFRMERRSDSFRGWLWGITRNKLKEFSRRRAAHPQAVGGSAAHARMQELAALPVDESMEFRQSDTMADFTHRVLEAIRVEFEEKTWRAFWRTTVDEQSSVDLADELQMTPKAIRQCKYRVLRRLRQELADGVDGRAS